MTARVLTIDELTEICAGLRKRGKRIAHCHGAFDLLHPGHIKHLQAARRLGDALVVTVTEDRFIRKGPGRPVFNERLRAETLASIDAVDYVATAPWETGVECIERIKPHLYVKGQDYRDLKTDATGAILREKEAVERHGGQLAFTEEIQFSSSKLLNEFFSVLTPEQKEYLDGLKSSFAGGDILAWLDRLSEQKVLIVGEGIIDEYHYCFPDAMSNKAPTISARFEAAEVYAGGVAAVGNHLADLAGSVTVLAGVGGDNGAETFSDHMSDGVQFVPVFNRNAPTVRKRRFVNRFLNQKMFEVTFLDDRPIDDATQSALLRAIDEHAPRADAVLVLDFGHGWLTAPVIERLRKRSIFLAVNAQINSSNRGFNSIRKYGACDYISVDEYELRLPFGERYGALETLVGKLRDETDCRRVNITLGTNGTLYYDGESYHRAPVVTGNVVDTIGAGDALMGITSLLVCAGAPSPIIPFVGNCMGGLMSQIVGHRQPVNAVDLRKFITTLMK